MPVRFIIGRAGSGKTWRCLEAVRARLRLHPVHGLRLLILVPEQASFQMERALIETPDIPGYVRCEVLSFQRLAYRVFAQSGAGPRAADQTIGPLGRLMAVRRLIRRERSRLQLLGRVADKPGLIPQVAGAIDELMREQVPPAALAELAERTAPEDPLGSARLADLTRLYQAYVDYLIEDRLDPAQYLALAAERLAACSWVHGAEVWVDGFAGFTQQELGLLVELARHAASVEITLLLDPHASAITANTLPRISYSLFARTERTLIRLRRQFTAAGVTMEEPVRLVTSAPARFISPELTVLESGLFHGSATTTAALSASTAVHLCEAPDRRSEVEAAVAEIQRLVRTSEPPMRYRDMAIIVRDLTAYHDLLAAALRACAIPCFIDRRQPTTHHPLVELVRALLAAAVTQLQPDPVRQTLKTGLLPLSRDECDLLENYLLAHAIVGRAAWRQEWRYMRLFGQRRTDETDTAYRQQILERVNASRVRWLDSLAPWLDAAIDDSAAERTGREWCAALYACLERLKVAHRLHEWAGAAESDGRTDEADHHRQVWTDFTELLDEFVRALGSEWMKVEEFRETLEAGLAEFNLGLAPPTLDQVLIGSIERSRNPDIRAALILGFDEQHFPLKRREDPLLDDSDRERLEAAGIEVGSPRRRQLADERMLAYIALTRARERVWISYPRADASGKPLRPSPYVEDIKAALPGLRVEVLSDAVNNREITGLTGIRAAAENLARELRLRPALDQESNLPARAAWNDLYEELRGRTEWRGTLSRCLAGLGDRNVAEIDPGLMDRVTRVPFAASVSRLERFAACPFAHFSEYMLKLRPRVEAQAADVDLGLVCHAILESFVGDLAAANQGLAELSDDQIAERVDAVVEGLLPRLQDEFMLAQARNAFLFNRNRGHLLRVTRWQRDAARVSRYRPRRVELRFGFGEETPPPLKLTTPKGRELHLRGVIDRVDLAESGAELLGVIIDYKRTTDRRLDLTRVYHGLSLQLVGYLLALSRMGESLMKRRIQPAGAFFLPLLEPYRSVPHPDEEKSQSFRLRGVADLTAIEALDETARSTRESSFLSARIKKDGTPDERSDLVAGEDLTRLMDHVARRMGELADRLLDGEIGVRPYRLRRQTPCGSCLFRSVCRYEIQTQPPRTLESFRRSEALARIREEAKA